MKEIEWLAESMEEEINDADKYAVKAHHYKLDDPELSRTCAELARQELEHSNMLHNQAERLIKNHRKEHGEPPAAMKAIWDWEHEKIVKRANGVRAMLSEL